MKHVKLECTDSECDGNHCALCNLFTCSVCNCSEGELPTDCPGAGVVYELRSFIYDGYVDFKDKQWVRLAK